MQDDPAGRRAASQGEFRKLVQQEKPFAVIWNASLCSACFDELSKLKTVNLGGWNFRDEFGQRWRPYHYDVTESGTRLAQHAGRFWCNQLAGQQRRVLPRATPASPASSA